MSLAILRRRSKNWPAMTEDEFRLRFRGSPIQRAKYAGFLRNVAVAMGNSGLEKFREPLERLAAFPNPARVRSSSSGPSNSLTEPREHRS